MIEIRTVGTYGDWGLSKRGPLETFWGHERFRTDCGVGYTDVYICYNLSNCMLKMRQRKLREFTFKSQDHSPAAIPTGYIPSPNYMLPSLWHSEIPVLHHPFTIHTKDSLPPAIPNSFSSHSSKMSHGPFKSSWMHLPVSSSLCPVSASPLLCAWPSLPKHWCLSYK